MTWFPQNLKTSNRPINMICLNIIYYKKLCHGIHMIHTPVNFLRELYHTTLPMEFSLPVTLHLHHHQITHHCHKKSHLQEIQCHTTTHPKRYHTYQTTLINTPVCQILICCTRLIHRNPVVRNEENVRVRKSHSERHNNDPIKECVKLTDNLLRDVHNSRVTRFKLEKDPLQWRVYLLNFMNSLKKIIKI